MDKKSPSLVTESPVTETYFKIVRVLKNGKLVSALIADKHQITYPMNRWRRNVGKFSPNGEKYGPLVFSQWRHAIGYLQNTLEAYKRNYKISFKIVKCLGVPRDEMPPMYGVPPMGNSASGIFRVLRHIINNILGAPRWPTGSVMLKDIKLLEDVT